MTTLRLIPLLLILAAIAPTAATAAMKNPQSDAAMRKGIRDYARSGLEGKTLKVKATDIRCTQAAEVGSTGRCHGSFSLTHNGRTVRYRLTTMARTERISQGAMQYNLRAKAARTAPGLPARISFTGILQ